MLIEVAQHVRVIGERACFTRPETRAERYSYPIPSVSASCGILSGVNSHRGAHYIPDQIALLFHPRWETRTMVEIKDFNVGDRTLRTTAFVAGNRRIIRQHGFDGEVFEKIVSGVDYILSFRMRVDDIKYHKMTVNRLRNGHHWRTIYLGQTGNTAAVMPIKSFDEIEYPDMPLVDHGNGLRTADYNADLGICFYGIDWDDPTHEHAYYFAPLKAVRGIVRYPSWEEVRKLGIKKQSHRSCSGCRPC